MKVICKYNYDTHHTSVKVNYDVEQVDSACVLRKLEFLKEAMYLLGKEYEKQSNLYGLLASE